MDIQLQQRSPTSRSARSFSDIASELNEIPVTRHIDSDISSKTHHPYDRNGMKVRRNDQKEAQLTH